MSALSAIIYLFLVSIFIAIPIGELPLNCMVDNSIHNPIMESLAKVLIIFGTYMNSLVKMAKLSSFPSAL